MVGTASRWSRHALSSRVRRSFFHTRPSKLALRTAKCSLPWQSAPALTLALGLVSTCFFTTLITPLGRRAFKMKMCPK